MDLFKDFVRLNSQLIEVNSDLDGLKRNDEIDTAVVHLS